MPSLLEDWKNDLAGDFTGLFVGEALDDGRVKPNRPK